MYILCPDQVTTILLLSKVYVYKWFSLLKENLILLKIMCTNTAVVLHFSWVCFKAVQLGENPCPNPVEEVNP